MKSTNLKEDFKSIQILHLALFIGLFLFMVVIYYLMDKSIFSFPDIGVFEIVGVVLAIINMQMVVFVNRMRVPKIKKLETVEQKLSAYKGLQIAKFALIEGAAMICVILSFISGNMVLMIIALALALMLYILRPTLEKFFNEASVSLSDQNKF